MKRRKMRSFTAFVGPDEVRYNIDAINVMSARKKAKKWFGGDFYMEE